MKLAVDTVNWIKTHPVKDRLFQQYCEDHGKSPSRLLLHTEARWLSRGKMLARFVLLFDEICEFIKQEKIFPQLCSHSVRAHLSFLADLYLHLNNLNRKMQGRNITVIKCKAEIENFIQNIAIFRSRLQFWHFEGFLRLAECADTVSQDDLRIFVSQLDNLSLALLTR